MDRWVTVNYGRLGGTLDATKHVEAAIPRLLTASECHRCEFVRMVAPVPQVAAVDVMRLGRNC